MEAGRGSTFLIVLAACAGVFVWTTGSGLPDIVASHFGTSGAPNGSMPRTVYLIFMLAFVAGLPLALTLLTGIALGRPGARINVPHRDYWLGPERRDETVAFLRRQFVRFSSMLVVFLCYVHWLVVRANAVQPPILATPWLIGGLVVFLIASAAWAISMIGHFRRPPFRGRSR